ncbi:glycoside hydrolase family 32 protein [Lactiplantibacillus modestisalitolerans]|uniref:Sucrose-6-phosphate hydrolase n=1 Tax=Lactiplantibacillus modestisalitolerans TaxID=1457219 RepID=A0ABV5WV28_9LACO|nr:glycoside hydrolase family 32 protein [Lactiplantibacillus modestisalitolerans]
MQTQTPITVTNSRYRLGDHLMAKAGWINDPNGFCYFKGYYHVFYQHYPYGAEWGPMHWGHARSRDLVHWETLPIALTPGDPEDQDGCFSGSAIVKDDCLYLLYTGHHYYGDNDPDHFWQNQNMAYSTDGVHFTKYAQNPVIAQAPADNTQHFRDPKVWQHGDAYYMILGSQGQDQLGRVILYRSSDLKHWTYLGPIAQATNLQTEGYMWECPDLFELDGQTVLLTSPQGIQAEAKRFLNLNQTGYFIGELDYQQPQLVDRGAFSELDHGHDFYASQTTLTPDGRRIVIGWMAMWESVMPEQADGWAGALTFPRELTRVGKQLRMKPARELTALRTQTLTDTTVTLEATPQRFQPTHRQAEFKGQLDLTTTPAVVTLAVRAGAVNVTLTYDQARGELTLRRSDRSDARYAQVSGQPTALTFDLWLDTSSLEVFLNDGAVTFTERFYPQSQPHFELQSDQALSGHVQLFDLTQQAVTY